MLVSGFAFWRNGHPWFVLTDPVPKSGNAVFVNLTTLDEECIDAECVLSDSDYAWIEKNHPTAVAFSRAEVWDVLKIEAAVNKGLLKTHKTPPIPAATLAKVRSIAKTARELSNDLKKLL